MFDILCASLLPGGRVVVGTKAALRLRAIEDAGKDVCELRGHQGGVLAVAASRDGRYLVSAGLDSTFRLWDLGPLQGADPPKVLRPTLSFFTAGPEYWIAWTPEGYYAASPNGEQIMGWLKDNGPDRLLSFYTADQFRKSLYKPEAIRALLAAGSLEKALGRQADQGKPLEAADILPPNVLITEPASGEIVDRPFTLRATAQQVGNDPVTGLRLLVDGRPFPAGDPQLSPAARGGKVEATWEVTAPSGRHRFSVLAKTRTAEGRSCEVYVTNTAPTPRRLFFLAIGVNNYQNVPKLDCAVSDATALEKAILAQHRASSLFDEVKTRVLTDEQATPEKILAAFDWLKTAEADDIVVIFYAGHGDRDDKGEFQLLTAAFNPNHPEGTFVSGKDLKERLAALKARRVLMLLDACHSGSIATDALAGDLKQPECGVAVLCAAQGNETSLESSKDQHGYFTKWLLDGLRGAAGNDAGEVTLARLYVHVEEKVPADTADQQHPVLVGLSAIRSFALAKAAKP